MRAVDVGATVGADGVEIKLPRLRMVVERRQAERLRDALATVLPMQPGRYMLCMWDHTDPELCGPYKDEQDRIEAAQDFQRAHGDGNSMLRVDSGGSLKVAPFDLDERQMPKPSKWVSDVWIEGRNATVHENAAGQFELHVYETHNGRPTLAAEGKFPHHGRAERAGRLWTNRSEWDLSEAIRGCCLCKCEATGEVHGLPVCDYHTDHTEDDPRCSDCVPVHTGDRVRDPLDGTWRTVARLDLAESTAHMADGGCMSLDEAGACEKRLPSEALPS